MKLVGGEKNPLKALKKSTETLITSYQIHTICTAKKWNIKPGDFVYWGEGTENGELLKLREQDAAGEESGWDPGWQTPPSLFPKAGWGLSWGTSYPKMCFLLPIPFGGKALLGWHCLFFFYSQWKYLWRVERFQVSASEVLDGGRAGGKAGRSQSGQIPCGQPSARPVWPPSLCVAGLRRQPVLGAPFVWATFRRSCVTGQQSGHDLWLLKPLKPQRAPPFSHLGPPNCDQTQPNSSKQSSKGRNNLFFRKH